MCSSNLLLVSKNPQANQPNPKTKLRKPELLSHWRNSKKIKPAEDSLVIFCAIWYVIFVEHFVLVVPRWDGNNNDLSALPL